MYWHVFLALEKESERSGKVTPAFQDGDQQQLLEESALVEAIRDTFLPALSGADAAIFATLAADVFERANVPMIFQNGTHNGAVLLNNPVINIEQINRKSTLSMPVSNEKG